MTLKNNVGLLFAAILVGLLCIVFLLMFIFTFDSGNYSSSVLKENNNATFRDPATRPSAMSAEDLYLYPTKNYSEFKFESVKVVCAQSYLFVAELGNETYYWPKGFDAVVKGELPPMNGTRCFDYYVVSKYVVNA